MKKPRHAKVSVVALVLFTATVTTPAATAGPAAIDEPCGVTASDLRSWAIELSDGNPTAVKLINALDRRVRTSGAALSDPIDLLDSAKIDLQVLSRYSAYRASLIESVRKYEPVAGVMVPSGVVVIVRPLRVDAPDIEKIVVTRDGAIIQPLSSNLERVRNTFGATIEVHGGSVTFPCAAFAPGGIVKVIAVPTAGDNISKELSPTELAGLR